MHQPLWYLMCCFSDIDGRGGKLRISGTSDSEGEALAFILTKPNLKNAENFLVKLTLGLLALPLLPLNFPHYRPWLERLHSEASDL